jgi:hypothetical protein
MNARRLAVGVALLLVSPALIHCSSEEAQVPVPQYVSPEGDAPATTPTVDAAPEAAAAEQCTTLSDDDGDGLWQCDDDDCAGKDVCRGGATPIAGECAKASDCAADNGKPLCLDAKNSFSRGYCSQFCSLTKQDCPDGSSCTRDKRYALAGHGDRGYCFLRCADVDAGDAGAQCPGRRRCGTSGFCYGE